MPNISFRDSQSYCLGFAGGIQPAAANHLFTATVARDVMLARPILQLENGQPPGGYTDGDIVRFDVAGQSVLTTNAPAHCAALNAVSQNEGAGYIGIPLAANSQVFLSTNNYTGAAPGPIAVASVLADPWDTNLNGPVPSVDSLGSSGLSVLAGLGSVVHAGGVQALQLQATCLRTIQLGMLCIDYHSTAANASANEFAILTSLRINQTELLASVDGVALSAFSHKSVDVDLKTISMIAPLNSTITAQISTIAGAPAGVIKGSIWALPA